MKNKPEKITLYTQRMILRPWRTADAQALYEYARDPRIGPMAGWPAHTSVENSRQVIKEVFSAEETYAIVLKDGHSPIGSIDLTLSEKNGHKIGRNSGELGYWIGVPFWGRGLIPEAVREMLRHSFEDLALTSVWCGYFEGNENSRRVQEKCGFVYHHTEPNEQCPLLNETRKAHFCRITKAQWLQNH